MDYCMNGALVVPQSLLRTRLGDMIDTDGELDGAKVKLFKNDIVPSPTTILADLTPAAFGGYVAKDVVWGSVFNEPDGGAGVSGGAPSWVTTDAADETIYGWYLTDTAGTGLLAIARLAEPQHLGAIGVNVQVNVEYYLSGPVGPIVPVV